MTNPDRSSGWDAKAIHDIARDLYGGLPNMFTAHGWDDPGNKMMVRVPRRVKETYGSVESFEAAHRAGLENNFILRPRAVLEQETPEVLLTSYFGFAPWDWSCLTFNDKGRRDAVLAATRPGFLAVIYGSNSRQTPIGARGKVLGIYQCSHTAGATDSFLSPVGLESKRRMAKGGFSWSYAIEAIRAWRIAPDTAPKIADFAPTTYAPERGTPIGRFGTWLTPQEALGILNLELIPEPTFGSYEQVKSVLSPAEEALRPSPPGPVSQSSYMVGEAEGPKHLYVLRLNGNADHFLGRSAEGRAIIKVGFSKSPETRCIAHNRVLPAGAFSWHVLQSTLTEGRKPFATSGAAKEGEQAIIEKLVSSSSSLGGEFFLADQKAIDEAWAAGLRAAEHWQP